MGTFGGHALPGSFFVVFGVWWTVQMCRRYFASRAKPGVSSFKSTVTYPADFCRCGPSWLRRWQWEGFFKMFFAFVGFLGEVITATHGGQFLYMNNGQHATMFFFFGMSGLVDILVHHHAPLPQDIDYMVGCLAFVVEAVLFKFHLHGRTEMDVLIHTLLLYVVYVNIMVVGLEIRYRHSIVLALARAYSVFLQGTWFWQAGFLLYNPVPGAVRWREDDHEQMMVVTMMFTWHMAGVLVVMVCIGAVVAACQTGRCRHTPADISDELRLLRRNGDTLQSGLAVDYDAELDSDGDTVELDLTRPSVRHGDDVIQ